jgi:hypothetical protein
MDAALNKDWLMNLNLVSCLTTLLPCRIRLSPFRLSVSDLTRISTVFDQEELRYAVTFYLFQSNYYVCIV